MVEINEPNLDKIGIGQLELRLEEIQTYTSIDHDALDPAVLDELKAFRKGAVYSNNDIRNSKTLFVAARNELEEIIFPMITIDIASVSILQTYEGFEDWGKVRIGEKVDIFVPQLKISIEAEIVELGMNFQDYSTSVKISTVRNYDKSFGRIFSNVFLLGNKTSKNEVLPLQKPTERAKEFLNDNSKNISDLSGSSVVVGVGGSNNSLQFDNMDIASSFVDTATDTLTTTPPLYYTEQEIAARGTAQITNGGLYIKDAEGEVRIKMNALEGLVGFKTDKGVTTESFKIDLEGNATFAGRLEAASGTFGEVSVNREFAVYEASVLTANLPSGYIISNIVYTGEEQLEGLFLEDGDSKSLDATTSSQITSETFGASEITNE